MEFNFSNNFFYFSVPSGVAQNLFLKRSVDEDFANNNDHHRRTLDDDIEEPMDAEHDNTKEHDEKDSEDEKIGLSPGSKMPFPASFLGLAGSPLTIPPTSIGKSIF